VAQVGGAVVFGVVLLAVCVLYVGAFLISWHLARHQRLDVTRIMRNRRAFADPLTRRFQQWCQTQKMEAVRQQQWSRLRALIFANHLVAAALVGRTLYGITIAPAVYFTYRQGVRQGTFAAQPSLRPRGSLLRVMVLELGAYLLVTALGVNLVMTPVVGGAFREAIGLLIVFYPVVAVVLLLVAWQEVNFLSS